VKKENKTIVLKKVLFNYLFHLIILHMTLENLYEGFVFINLFKIKITPDWRFKLKFRKIEKG
jgi:hypothetical protein